MFQLTDAILERIVFAMEDQTNEWLVDLRTGDIIERSEVDDEDLEAVPELYSAPPFWSSRQGFSILEAFAATVTSPPELKLALNAALRRGKGVFKAFRYALSSNDALYRRFQEFKLNAMRPVIEKWMHAIQEEHALAAVKEEPEDLADIIASELEIQTAAVTKAPFDAGQVISDYTAEIYAAYPPALSKWALLEIHEKLTSWIQEPWVAYASIDGTHPLALGIYSIKPLNGAACCIVWGIFASKECATMGIEWSLLDKISSAAAAAGASSIILDGPLFPSSLNEEASSHGFMQTGSSLWKML
jgi:hypothetical protein